MSFRWCFAALAALSVALAGCDGDGGKPPASSGAKAPAGDNRAGSKLELVAAPKTPPEAQPKAEPKGGAAEAAEPVPAPKTDPPADPKAEPKVSKDTVVAVVDGEKLTREDLDAFIQIGTRGQEIPPDQRATVDREALEMLINQRLLKKFIAGQKVEIDPELLFDVKLRSYVQSMSAGPKTEAEALAKVQALKKELDGGADFAELARKNSSCPSAARGGDLGEFTSDKMVPAFSEAVKGLKLNGVSGPVKTQFGYHVIQRLAVKDPAAKDTLHARHILVRVEDPRDEQVMRKNFQKLITDVRSKAKIDNKLPPAPAGAPKGLPDLEPPGE